MSFALVAMLAFLVVMALMGFPIGFSLFGSGILYFLIKGQDPTLSAGVVLFGLFSTFILIAVPLFIFAARIMNDGKVTDRLLDFAMSLMGSFRGGLAQVNVLTSLIFAGMSGAATADVAGVGNVLMKMMTEKNRYTPGFAAAITVASATIGPVFPPSLIMIFYGLVAQVSIGGLFLGGMVPGILMALALMATVAVVARRRNFPVEPRPPWSAYPRIFLRAVGPLLMPVILLAGIYSGAFTPTEAAAVAGLYALMLAIFGYRTLGPRELYRALAETAKTTGIVSTLIFGAFVFSHVLTSEQIPQRLAEWLTNLQITQLQFLLLVNLLFLILGTVLASATIILVIVPLLMPAVHTFGIDPVHFGVVVTFNVTIGLVTPPYGVVLFVMSGLTGVPIKEIVREAWLFIGVLIAALLVIVLVPELTLFVPRFFGF